VITPKSHLNFQGKVKFSKKRIPYFTSPPQKQDAYRYLSTFHKQFFNGSGEDFSAQKFFLMQVGKETSVHKSFFNAMWKKT
jgi:hypothetical protein